MLLENQVAIITGASRGLGRATAVALAEAGASVVLAARSGNALNDLATDLKQAGHKALAIPTDVADLAEVDHLLVLTMRAFGRVDILVNNAALVEPLGKVWETSPQAWHHLLAVNVMGPYLCARTVLPHMLERGTGRIINLSSGAADSNLVGASAYNASKAALERLSGTLAAEVADTDLAVTVLRPGIVDTAMQAHMRETPGSRFPLVERWQEWKEQGQLRPPEEPARAIVWLASPFAADANGQTFDIDQPAFRERLARDLEIPVFPGRER